MPLTATIGPLLYLQDLFTSDQFMKFSTSLPKTYPAPFQNQNPFNMKLSYPSSVNTNHLPTRSAPWWRTFLLVGTILLGALSLIPSTAVAQTVTIGAGTLTQRYPLGSFYGYERSAALYTTTEMSAVAGSNITTVSWYCTVTGPARPVVIYLKTGTASPLTAIPWSTMITGATQVYTGSFTPVANTWNTFTLSAPFNYAGQNLVVMVESNIGGGGAGGSAAPSVQYTASTGNHALVVADNSPPTGNLAVTASRPNIQLGYSGGAPCAGIPAPGNTTGPASTLSGSTINLGLQNVTTGSGVTYQWEQNIHLFTEPHPEYTIPLHCNLCLEQHHQQRAFRCRRSIPKCTIHWFQHRGMRNRSRSIGPCG